MVRTYYKKRNYNRKGKTLSKRNVYRNRNAYSQAKQIAALTRKINKVSQQNRPEIISKLFQASKTFNDTSNLNDTYFGFQIQPNTDAFFNYDAASYAGGSFPAMNGQFLQLWGGSLKFSIQYNSPDIVENNRTFNANVRVVILMRKSSYNISMSNTPPSGYIDSYSVENYKLLHLYPLKTGITSECRVLYDKFFKLDSAKNTERSFKFKIPKTRLEKMANVSYPKYCIFGYIIVNGIDNTMTDSIKLDSVMKVNYSDNQ